LGRLEKREPPLVTVLPRQPGTKEARYAHLLGDAPPVAPIAQPHGASTYQDHAASASHHSSNERIEALVAEVADLRKQIADLQSQFAAFRKQFE
jgi:uncharacterized protein YceH (UPF0502 family)